MVAGAIGLDVAFTVVGDVLAQLLKPLVGRFGLRTQ